MARFTIRYSKLPRLTLYWEIGIVLVIKIILLWLLWYFFFSTPEAKHMQVPPAQVTQHLLVDNFTEQSANKRQSAHIPNTNSNEYSP